jgi:very-short-patch-repair endonuclease
MSLTPWLAAQGGLAHRAVAAEAGFGVRAVRAEAAAGRISIVRRSWIATPSAPSDLLTAAQAGARLACVSVARHRGWWLPPLLADRPHLHLRPHAASDGVPADAVAHWSVPLAPPASHSLLESTEDALRHIAQCLPPEAARVVWESAIRAEGIALDTLRQVRWRSPDAAALALEVRGLSDSGLETQVIVRLSHWGIPMTQQAVVAGRRVDILIGERLVVQIDGYTHHRTSAQRGKDIAHDAELRLRGFTVLRFDYAQVVYAWPSVERTIARAIAAGLHLAR